MKAKNAIDHRRPSKIQKCYDPVATAHVSLLACFVGLTSLVVLRPSMAFGQALDFVSFCIIVLTIFVSVFAVNRAGLFLFGSRQWNSKQVAAHYATTIVGALMFGLGLLVAFDLQGQIHEALILPKIEYFCAANFDHARCVENITLCPNCVAPFDLENRAVILANLKASHEERLRQAQEEGARQNNRLPASQKK